MEEEVRSNPNNRLMVILLGVVVLLLVGIIAYIVLSGGSAKTADNSGTTGTGTTNTGTNTGATAETPFDPATATVVEAGVTPEQHVKKYFDEVIAGDFENAFKLLPTAKQKEYGDVAAFTTQLQGYGITSYKIDSSTENGDQWDVQATATMQGGDFSYLWTFVKDGDKWLVKSRTLPGMQ